MQISSRLNKHLAVAAAAAACVSAANAVIIYSGVVNIVVPANVDGVYINVQTGQYLAGAGAGVPGWDCNPYGTSLTSVALYAAVGTGYMRNPGAGTSTSRTNIAAGTAIGSTSFFYGSSNATIGTLVGQWTANTTGIFGFKFVAADTLTHYGWMRLAIGANAATRTIVDYGFESTAATTILAGAGIPAPGAVALLGLAGLISRRRRA
ncbi:MAG: hypothetical protein EXS17_01900 [Phycisphaerales bacterium]|nr:hypothetical protein [Phycisphaerales bacterium]